MIAENKLLRRLARPAALLFTFVAAANRAAAREVPMHTNPDVQLSEWRELPGGWGDALAADGARSVAASSSGVTIWDNDARQRTVVPQGAFAVGLPRLVGSRIVYGTGRERADGRFEPLQLPNFPGGPRWAAWSADGARVAVLWVDRGEGRIVELAADRGGAVVREVWRGAPPPGAMWLGSPGGGEEVVVAVGRDLLVFGRGGERRAEGHAGEIAALGATRDESLLLTVGWEGTAKLWPTRTFAAGHPLAGEWAGGALAPDGRVAALLTRGHALVIACVERAHATLVPSAELHAPAGLAAILMADAPGGYHIVGSFHEGARVRTARLQVRCP
jgi:hypothetical protein